MSQGRSLRATPAVDLAEQIQRRDVSSVDVVHAYLAHIEKSDAKLAAFRDVFHEEALRAAEAADRLLASGQATGRLHGVPVALKDLVDIQGRRTAMGSRAYAHRIATETAEIVNYLRAAGAIIVGKTHMVELALGGWGTNGDLGTPWNPWDIDEPRIPGGSSSGSGVAVAAGQVPFAIGTDTGGSVRMPASFCGITALKPSLGAISTAGLLPLSTTLDTVGPMTRSVADATLLFQVLRGDTARPPSGAYRPPQPLSKSLRGLRVAVLPPAERDGVSADVLRCYDDAIATFAAQGAQIAPFASHVAFSDYAETTSDIMLSEGLHFYQALATNPASALTSVVRARLLSVSHFSATRYLAALARRDRDGKDFDVAMADFDVLLTPTTETTAVRLSEIPEGAPARFTRVANLFGLCALSLPCGFDPLGLPASLQIIGRKGDDAAVLAIGEAYQALTDWHCRLSPAFDLGGRRD